MFEIMTVFNDCISQVQTCLRMFDVEYAFGYRTVCELGGLGKKNYLILNQLLLGFRLTYAVVMPSTHKV